MNEKSPFLMGHATADNWTDAAGQVVVALGQPRPEHKLGFVYVSDGFAGHLDELCVFLRQTTGVNEWVGAAGAGVCATGREYFEVPAIAALVAPIDEAGFRIFESVTEDAAAVGTGNHDWLVDAGVPLVVAHADPANPLVPELIEDLSDETGGYLVGALGSGPNGNPQFAHGLASGGISGVMISPNAIEMVSGLTQGCSPIGPVRRISSAHENVILSIDDGTALAVFKEDIGEVLARNLGQVAGYIFAGLPVEGSDTGDYLVRNLTGIDPENEAIAIGDYVETGDQILFCRRDHDTAVEDMRRMLRKIKRQVGDKPIRGGLYYTCLARGPNQFGDDSEEMRLIEEELGSFPVVGFFGNGEISHDRLYGYTGVLTVFC